MQDAWSSALPHPCAACTALAVLSSAQQGCRAAPGSSSFALRAPMAAGR